MKIKIVEMTRSVLIASMLLVGPPSGYSFLPEKPVDNGKADQPVKGKPAKVRQVTPAQRKAAQLAEADGIKVQWHPRHGTPTSIRGERLAEKRAYTGGKGLALSGGQNPEKDAIAVMDNLSPFYGIRDAENEFAHKKSETDTLGFQHIRITQMYRGLPVFGGELIVHFDKNGQAYQANGKYVPEIKVDINPKLNPEIAVQIAQKDLSERGKPEGQLLGDPKLVVFALESDPQLAYEFTLVNQDPKVGTGIWRYWVDAQQGEVLLGYDDVKKLNADSSGSSVLITGNIMPTEGDQIVSVTGLHGSTSGMYFLKNFGMKYVIHNNAATGLDPQSDAYRSTAQWGTTDPVEMSAAKNFEIARTYFSERHGREGWNNAGGSTTLFVHYRPEINSSFAFYPYPSPQMPQLDVGEIRLGDGCEGTLCTDGVQSKPLATLDIMGHEFTHGVTDTSAKLIYNYESGALCESFSDIFGTCIEFFQQPVGPPYPAKVAGTADWLLGEDSMITPLAFRDMKNPSNTDTVGGLHKQPSRYLDAYWYTGNDDNGGVHQNSGVQNFFFYLLCQGGSGINNGIAYNVTGIGILHAEKIAYRALTVYCYSYTDYNEAATAWISAAIDLYPNDVPSVVAAWAAVGLPASCSPLPFEAAAVWALEGGASDLTAQNPGTVEGVLSYEPAVVQDGAVFNGSAAINVPASATLDVSSAPGFTIETWLNPSSLSPRNPIVEWARAGGYSLSFGILEDGAVYGSYSDLGGNPVTLISPPSQLQANTFSHVGLTFDNGSHKLKLFVNGRVIASRSSGPAMQPPTGNVLIGRGNISDHFTGMLDELSVFRQALSDSQMYAIYYANEFGKCRCALEDLTPTGLRAELGEGARGADVHLSWTPPCTGDYPSPVGSYVILRDKHDGNGFQVARQVNTEYCSYYDYDISCTAYTYIVRAYSRYFSERYFDSLPVTPTEHLVPPTITVQPQVDPGANCGANLTLSVTASGLDLHYQWQKDGVDLSGDPSSMAPSYTVYNDRDAVYTVRVYNRCGSVISDPVFLNPPEITPAFLSSPVNLAASVGGNISFTVNATGCNLHYQWKHNGINVGTDSFWLQIPYARLSDAGNYTVTIWNSAGSVTGPGGSLTVTCSQPPAAPMPVIQPRPSSIYLHWDAVDCASSYILKRGTSPGNYNLIVPNITALEYEDTQVSGCTTYYYALVPVGEAGQGNCSVEVSGNRALGISYTMTNGCFQVIVTGGGCGQTAQIEASSDLLNWTSLHEFTIGYPEFFIDPESGTVDSRFYRAKQNTDITRAVGYYKLSLHPSWNFVANQLNNPAGNNIAALLPNPSVAFQVDKWNSAAQTWWVSSFANGVWSDPALTFNPGEGMAINNTGTEDVTITFSGFVPTGDQLSLPIQSGQTLISCPLPISGLLDPDMFFPQPMKAFTRISVPKPDQTCSVYDYIGDDEEGIPWEWDYGAPHISIGKAFWCNIFGPRTWTLQNYSDR